MNRLATIGPVFGIGDLTWGLTLIDDNESNVNSFTTDVVPSPFGLDCCSYKKVEVIDNKISSLIYYENLVIDSSYYKKKCNFQNITNAKKIKKSVLSLPINGYQNLKETKYICDKILLFFKHLN